LYVVPRAWSEITNLRGHVRQRVRREIDALARNPRPAGSKALGTDEPERELRRLRLDRWRIVYAITEAEKTVDVLPVRRRPPYDYGDLEALMATMR